MFQSLAIENCQLFYRSMSTLALSGSIKSLCHTTTQSESFPFRKIKKEIAV